MTKLSTKLKSFFLPSSDAGLWTRLLPFVVLGVATITIAVGSLAGWNYTNSTAFCGTSCHTMPPEYSSYLRSPHARVECVECHLGRDSLTVQLPRKIAHSETLYALIFHTYEYPIIAKKMRPANEACETCHYPNKFSNDSVAEIRNYTQDENNTYQSIFLMMKIGGGTKRQGLGRGIHWHVENQVTFLSTDPLQQNIPYVRVEDQNGEVKEYYDISSGTTPETVKGAALAPMDCITCHNRVTHIVPTPEQAVGQALSKGLLPADLPFVNQQAVKLLSAPYKDMQSANAAFDGLKSFYSANYPKIYSEQPGKINQAIEQLKTINQQIRFPEQNLDWNSHPNNLGHKDSPGCFRCHDGKHLTAQGEAIRLECNLCHSVPVVSDPSKFVTDIEVVRGPEPASHTNTSWMTLHGKVIDTTCASCHPPADPSVDYTTLTAKPAPDGSFCGNSACHTPEWRYTGFHAPEVYSVLEEQIKALKPTPTPAAPAAPAGSRTTYETTIKAVLNGTCGSCHTGSNAMAGMDLSTYPGLLAGHSAGVGIDPGNLENSRVYTVQSAGGHFGQLSPDQLTALKEWILDGAPEQ